jgi:hypothetical protein
VTKEQDAQDPDELLRRKEIEYKEAMVIWQREVNSQFEVYLDMLKNGNDNFPVCRHFDFGDRCTGPSSFDRC